MKELFEYFEKIEVAQGTLVKQALLDEAVSKYPSEAEAVFKILLENVVLNISSRSIEKALNLKHSDTEDIGTLIFNLDKKELFESLNMSAFNDLIEQLKVNKGNKAIELLRTLLTNLDALCSKWVVRILVKNLRLGLGNSSFLPILEKYGIKINLHASPQLCGKIDSVYDYDLGFPVLVGEKYDGLRCVAKKEGDKVTLTSRNGKDIFYANNVIEELEKIPFSFVLDGELIADNFNETQKAIGRKDSDIKLNYHVFDMLLWENVNLKLDTQETRKNFLEDFLIKNNFIFIKPENSMLVENAKELKDFYDSILAKKGEGIIVKLLDKPYVDESRDSWFKIKPLQESTFKVVEGFLGTGKYKDKINKILVCAGDVEGRVGAGVGDFEREEFAKMFNELGGRYFPNKKYYVDVAYFEVTSTENGRSLRFPRFIKFRPDKDRSDDL